MKIGTALVLLLMSLPLFTTAQGASPDTDPIASAKEVLQDIVAGQFNAVEARYNPQMAAALPPGTLATAWASLLEKAGSFDSVVSTSTSKRPAIDVVVLVCKFQQGLVDAQIAISSEGKLAGLHFTNHQEPLPSWAAPAYVKPDSFTEQPLTLVNGKFELPGILTLPQGKGPFRAAVLLQGSGPHDQDETIGPNKPLKDIAWGLATKGVAVFRYTKRTQKYGAQSNADPARLTVDDETISDARAAVTLLARQPGIDPKNVFVIGHSLGGYLAPRIATGDPEIAGIVMLAANTEPMEQLVVDQMQYLILANTDAATNADLQKQLVLVQENVKKIDSPDLRDGDTVTILNGAMPASYWLELRGYHPLDVARELKIPVLILQGARDFQVPPPTNFDQWKDGLARRRNVTFKLYSELNHLFMPGTGPSLPQEYDRPGHVDEQVVTDIAAWISSGGRPNTLQ